MAGDEKAAQILAAIGELVSGQEAPAKPNVKDVQEIVGFDLTAAERDEAWAAFEAEQADDAGDEAKESDAPTVENLIGYPLELSGTMVPKGEKRSVPGFDAEHETHAAWIAAGLLKVS